MFSPNDILTLSKAGFTAQQIAGLSMIANQQSAPAVPAPAVPGSGSGSGCSGSGRSGSGS
jgi:hypothetical protein